MAEKETLTSVVCPTHPGAILLEMLDEIGMSQKDLAVSIGKPSPIINDIIKGKRNINPELAVLLEAVLPSVSAEDWMSIQAQFDISNLKRHEEIQQQKEYIEKWNALKEYLNLNYIKKKLKLADDLGQSIDDILKYLNINDVNELKAKKDRVMGYFRKSDKSQTEPVNLLTWLCIVRHRSEEEKLNMVFCIENIEDLASKLNSIFYTNDQVVDKITKTLNSYGIKFYVENKLDKMAVDGVSFISSDGCPTIAMTGRMNRIDNFAFVLCHELGHIVKHLYNNNSIEFIDDVASPNEDIIEQEANKFAEDMLWKGFPKENAFKEIRVPFASARFLQQISNFLEINISIVVGQYQHYCAINNKTNSPYAICRNLIQKIG